MKYLVSGLVLLFAVGYFLSGGNTDTNQIKLQAVEDVQPVVIEPLTRETETDISPLPVVEQKSKSIAKVTGLQKELPGQQWANLSLDEKAQWISAKTNFDTDLVWQYQDVEQSLNRLYEIDTRQENPREHFDLKTPITASSALTSDQAIDLNDPKSLLIRSNFQGDVRSVYLYFWLSEDYQYDQVLIRWSGLDSAFSRTESYKINFYDPIHFSWLRVNKGWSAGRYRVRIYSLEEGMPLLSVADFSINTEQQTSLNMVLSDLSRPEQ